MFEGVLADGGWVLIAIVVTSAMAWAVWMYAWLQCRDARRCLWLAERGDICPEKSLPERMRMDMAVLNGRGMKPAQVRSVHLMPMLEGHLAGLRSFQAVLQGAVVVLPLLGLLGTVAGLVQGFEALALEDAMTHLRMQGLSSGIGQAMLTTQAGLLAALPLLIAHAWMQRCLHRYELNVEAWMHTLSARQAGEVR